MQEIKQRNLYLPILNPNRFVDHPTANRSVSVYNKNDISDILKLVQSKKAQLQKNIQNQQSGSSSDGQEYDNYEPCESANIKYKIPVLQHPKSMLSLQKSKMKTTLDERSETKDSRTSDILKNRNFRVRTQHNQNLSKSQKNYLIKKQNKIIKTQSAKPMIKHLKPNQICKQLGRIVPTIPQKIKQRNQTSLKQIVTFLKQQNPFFMKLDKIVVTCLLKVCNVIRKVKREIIYDRQTMYSKFYIILSGKVRLSHKQIQLKKICIPGQTILQQTWFNSQQRPSQSFEKARAIRESYLLEIPIQKFIKVKEQLTKFGFKTQYNQLEALIKRNYIVKNSLRLQKNKF